MEAHSEPDRGSQGADGPLDRIVVMLGAIHERMDAQQVALDHRHEVMSARLEEVQAHVRDLDEAVKRRATESPDAPGGSDDSLGSRRTSGQLFVRRRGAADRFCVAEALPYPGPSDKPLVDVAHLRPKDSMMAV